MTLTQTAKTFRLVVKTVGITIVGLFIFRASILIYQLLFPATPPTPPSAAFDAKYGQIPTLIMQVTSVQYTTPYTIRQDLLEYQLPTKPEVANVYPILKAPYGFLSEDRANDIANVFGFTGEPIKLNASDSRWTGPNKFLTINTQTLNFSYQYKYSLDSSVFKPGIFTSEAQVIKFASNLNAQYNITGSFADDLSGGQTQISRLKYLNQKLQPVLTIAEASAIRVDFLRNPVSIGKNTYPFVYPRYTGATTYTLIGSTSNGNLQAVEVYYRLWRYRSDMAGVYPMVSSQVAWENIQANPEKFTVYVGNLELGPMDRNTSTPIVNEVVVKQVYFAYYDTDDEQEYIQPVWVFIGKANLASSGQLDWVGYVPAIDPKYVKTSN